MSAGNEIGGAKYGFGFVIRITVLVALLGTVGFCYYNDTNVVIPKAEKKIDEAFELLNRHTDDGFGIPKDEVQRAIGFPPATTFSEGEYEIETYKFPRTIPISAVTFINVIYQDSSLVHIIHDKEFDLSIMKPSLKVVQKPWSPESLPASSVAGAGASGGGGRQQPMPKTPEAMNKFAEKNADNANALNQVAWGIVTKTLNGDEVSKEMIDAARAIADLAVKANANPNILDTQAHLAALQGNLDEAIKIQTIAVENAKGNGRAPLEKYLDELTAQKSGGSEESEVAETTDSADSSTEKESDGDK